MTSCVFCQIIAGDRSCRLVAENDLAVAFLDIRPVNLGHTLVVPRRHVSSFTDLTAEEGTAVFQLIQQIGRSLKSSADSRSGLTLSAADGEAAGQEVPHAHFHVIPRMADDGFGWKRYGMPMEE